MKFKLLFFIFCGLTFPNLLSAQLSKGIWMVNGQFDFTTIKDSDNRVINKSPASDFLVLPQVSFFISPKFQVNTELEISFVNKNTLIGQKLGGRFYFNSESKNRFFGGVVFGWSRQRSIFASGGFTFQYFQTRLDFGLDHFINENVALEFVAEYILLNLVKSKPLEVQNRITNGGVTLKWELQYFFNSRWYKESAKETRNFKRGTWMLGGYTILGSGSFSTANLRYENRSNDISPFVAYFLNPQWAVGTYFTYSNDIRYQRFNVAWTPMTRYFINLNHKKKIFGELAVGLGMDFRRTENIWNATNNIFRPKLSLGVANMLSKNVSLDVWIDYEQTWEKAFYERKNNTREIGIHMGLQAYID